MLSLNCSESIEADFSVLATPLWAGAFACFLVISTLSLFADAVGGLLTSDRPHRADDARDHESSRGASGYGWSLEAGRVAIREARPAPSPPVVKSGFQSELPVPAS